MTAAAAAARGRTSHLLSSSLHFLRVELAPSPRRWRATVRTTIACTLAALLIVSLHVPYGHWVIMTILVVHQPNAGASVRKGFERIVGTIAGSAGAILAIAAFAQEPWLAFPLIGFLCGFGLFISRTSVVPYAAFLSSVTAALFMSVGVLEPEEVVRQGLWRMLLICLGVVLATGAQLLLWPVDPEKELMRSLATSLESVAAALRRFLAGTADAAAEDALARTAITEPPAEVALLQAAEARYPSLRRRHVEQLVLIGSVSRLVTAAAALAEEGPGEGVDAATRRRLERIADACTAHAAWITSHDDAVVGAADASPHETALRADDARESDAGEDDAGRAGTRDGAAPDGLAPGAAPAGPAAPVSPTTARVVAHVIEMEKAIEPLPAALAFVGDPRGHPRSSLTRSPLDDVEEPTFLTPAFSLANTTDLLYAVKGGLSAMAAEAAANGLAMASPSTATVSAVIVAQGTVGASLRQATLRCVGAAVGGILAVLVMVFVFPSIASLVPFLAVVTLCFGVAGYVSAGGPRTAYAGIQIGMAFAMSILDTFGPTTDLTVPRDRVLGILLGIAIFTAIDFAIAPVFARREAARRIAAALEHMAALSQRALGETGDALRAAARGVVRPLSALRRQIVSDLTAALQREEEALLEPGALRDVESGARRARLALLHQAQATLLVVLAIVRDRFNLELDGVPLERRLPARAVGAAIAPHLLAVADRIEGRPPRAAPELAPLLAALEREAATFSDDPKLFPLLAQTGFYREMPALLAELRRRAEDYAASRDPSGDAPPSPARSPG